jgi:hypothetical protein
LETGGYQPISFYTSDAKRMKINAAGGVTVGNTVTASTIAATGEWQGGGTGNSWFSGNVGVGITNPDQILYVKSAEALITAEATGVSGNQSGVYFKGAGTNASWTIGTNRGDIGGAVDSFIFNKVAGTSGVKLVIQDNGNVGIGKTNPSAKLDVSGSLAISGSTLTVNTNGTIDMPGQAMAVVSDCDAGTSIPNGDTLISIPFKTSIKTTLNFWVAATSTTFTVPVSGGYEMFAHSGLAANNTGTARYLRIKKNSTADYKRGNVRAPDANNSAVVEVHAIDSLTAGDTIEFQIAHDASAALDLSCGANQTYGWVRKVW